MSVRARLSSSVRATAGDEINESSYWSSQTTPWGRHLLSLGNTRIPHSERERGRWLCLPLFFDWESKFRARLVWLDALVRCA